MRYVTESMSAGTRCLTPVPARAQRPGALAAAAAALLCALALAAPSRAEAPDDIVVVANNGLPISAITLGDLKDVFLKKRVMIGGAKVTPLNAPVSSETRRLFRQRVLGMTAQEEDTYWVAEQVKNALARPAEFSNTLKAVFKIRGGLSYMRRSEFKEAVGKIVLVIPAG